jgi:hypothetical protein
MVAVVVVVVFASYQNPTAMTSHLLTLSPICAQISPL